MTDVPQVRTAPEVPWLTPNQVAAAMNISAAAVRKHYERFGGVRVGDLYRFPPNYLDHVRAADDASRIPTDQPGRAAS